MQADQSAYLANMWRPVTLIAFGWKSYIGLEVQQLVDARIFHLHVLFFSRYKYSILPFMNQQILIQN